MPPTLLILSIAILGVATPSSNSGDQVFYRPVQPSATLGHPALEEASGVTPSASGGLWMLNDGGDGPCLYLTSPTGAPLGKIRVAGVKNHDWEDLDSFSHQGKRFLLVADTGDNWSRREFVFLHIVPEPPAAQLSSDRELTVRPARTIRFRYEDGPRDCEAVAVDPISRKILLISKRTDPPALYELPLNPPANAIARRIGTLRVNQPWSLLPLPFGNQPTALAIRPDGQLAAVLTYHSVFLFPRTPHESWSDAFAREPIMLPPHGLMQAEAVTFSPDGRTPTVLTEGRGSRIHRYEAIAQ